jgi:putative spermidine/putrescine transport system permease protein
METRAARIFLRAWTAAVVVFLWFPLILIFVYAFNASNVQSWPIQHYTTHWFHVAWHTQEVRDAVVLSTKAALMATTIALLLGSAAAFAIARFRFFGRESVSFLLVLPIALPGIITGMALNSFFTYRHINLSLWTIVIGHATFCVVVVYNNVLARLRRTGSSLEEASMDLGADTFRTFRLVTFPQLRSALLAGALLAFALSFDEIVVTTFTTSAGLKTVPIWVFENLFRPNAAPVVNVVAAMLILASVLPIWAAQRLSGNAVGGRL